MNGWILAIVKTEGNMYLVLEKHTTCIGVLIIPSMILFNIYHKNAQDKLMEEKVSK